jgi:hypothetical protein
MFLEHRTDDKHYCNHTGNKLHLTDTDINELLPVEVFILFKLGIALI